MEVAAHLNDRTLPACACLSDHGHDGGRSLVPHIGDSMRRLRQIRFQIRWPVGRNRRVVPADRGRMNGLIGRVSGPNLPCVRRRQFEKRRSGIVEVIQRDRLYARVDVLVVEFKSGVFCLLQHPGEGDSSQPGSLISAANVAVGPGEPYLVDDLSGSRFRLSQRRPKSESQLVDRQCMVGPLDDPWQHDVVELVPAPVNRFRPLSGIPKAPTVSQTPRNSSSISREYARLNSIASGVSGPSSRLR